MEVNDIAKRLYELCSQNQFDQAQKELFDANARSIEPPHAPGAPEVVGLENIEAKGKQFQQMVAETHDSYVKEPRVFGNFIAMEMGMDVTMKEGGRMEMNEMAMYEVKDGKIISEQFYF